MLRLSPRFILILVVLCGALPFLNQAFHIDDRIYLEIADNILKKPLFPYDYPPIFEGLITPDAGSHTHLPLISYYLALIKLLTGSEKEWVHHLAFLVFPLLAAMGFYDLAHQYVRFRLAAACLLVVSPAFLALSHTLMPDIPLLAFWIVCLSRFLRIADDRGSSVDWVICGLSLLAASFISLLSAGLVLLMMAHLLIERSGKGSRSERVSSILPIACLLALPILLWLLWYLRAYLHYDRFVLINTFLYMNKLGAFEGEFMGWKGLAFVLHLGGVFLFPVASWYGLAGRLGARIFLLIFFVSFVPFHIGSVGWTWLQVFLFALFFTSGLVVLWHIASCFIPLIMKSRNHKTREARGHEALLLLWFFGILLSCLFVYHAGSVRYSLLALPPVLLFWVMALERRVKDVYFLRILIWFGVLGTGFYALGIAYGDYEFAGAYRKTAQEITSDYAQPHQNIWFTGEWGFRYYLEKAGSKVLARTETRAKTGDIIVKAYVATPWVTLYDGDEHTQLLEQRLVHVDYPVRILDFSSHAGFYGTYWGILPFSFKSGEKWEVLNVFRIKKEVRGFNSGTGKALVR
ncbi:glycosyltransferase family 39 protein [Acidobacteria bacterium AH-259-L09]|nr:glycosyltransferase family 39 protein [Acidobacteria bacterium AH-259-L09]